MLTSLLIIAGGQVLAGNIDATAPPDPPEEIVVIGERLRLPVPGAIPPEATLDAGAIGALGANNIADIVTQISALTGGSQARAGDGPVVLVNGRRIGSFEEVKNLPPEAIERVDILPEEAALRMGYPANVKPVNIVLKPRYAATTGEAEDRVTTRGLRNDFNTELNAVKIAGDNRLTLDLQYQVGNAITEARRGVVRPIDALAANAGGVLSNPAGGALLPLTASFVGVPASGRSLADFAATPLRDDTGAWRTLVPLTRELTANGAFARAIGGGHTISLYAKFDRLTARDLLGPAIADATVPVGGGSPFAVPAVLRQVATAFAPQTRQTRTDTLHLGAQIAGHGRWQWSVTTNLDRLAIARDMRGGVDASAWQAAIDQNQITDPFAAPAARLLAGAPASHASSIDTDATAEAFASGPLARLPAGDMVLSLHASLGRETLGQKTLGANDTSGEQHLARTQLGGQATLDLPLASRHSPIGALEAGLNAALNRYSDAGTIHGWGANLTWQPRRQASLLLAASSDAAVPTMQQLGAPVQVTPAVAIYNFATGKSLTAARIDGGDPSLRADSRRLLKAELGLKPAGGLNLTATLTDLVDRKPVFAFAGLTPAFAAAFPGRILRDAAGDIVSFDARPFNAAREHRDELRLAAVFTRNFGKGSGPKLPGGGGFGGGHAFAATGSMLQFSLIDTLRLRDTLVLVPGAAPLGLVGADALGDGVLVPRQRIEAQLSATRNGIGLRANAVWTSGGSAGADTAGELRFADRFALNLRLFYFPASRETVAAAMPWLKGVRVLLAIDNLFDSWQRVGDRAGTTPLAYQRGLLDPIGRTLRFSIRKTLP